MHTKTITAQGIVASAPARLNKQQIVAKGIADLVMLAAGWHAELIATVDQSFAGWHVEIGDADNDKLNEVLVTGAPNSQLRMFKKVRGTWIGRVLAENLAQQVPGMGLTVKVVDLNNDGRNELVLGTGQEGGGEAFFYVLQTDGETLTRKISCRTGYNQSAYTHNLAVYDLDGDGIKEVISAYCGSGEVFRYNMDKELTTIKRTKVFQCSGSGEDAYIGDVDGDGKVECVICSCYRENQAKVHIFDFDPKGELILPPRITLEGYNKHLCFNCSVAVGDFDNDGKTELIVIWKRTYEISMGTIIAYRVNGNTATPVYTIAEDDNDLDTGYGERLIHVADADNDGKNELIVSTRGEGAPANGNGLGHVLMFKWGEDGKIQKTLLAKSLPGIAESCWSAVGDADNDGRNEIVIATGKGDRTKPGISYVWMMKKD